MVIFVLSLLGNILYLGSLEVNVSHNYIKLYFMKSQYALTHCTLMIIL